MKIQPTTGMVGSPQAFSREVRRNNKNGLNIKFNGNVPKPSPVTDRILKNKLVKWLFELSDKNPFAFGIVALATSCMALRPATVMVVPGSNDKDKKYAAGKSFIASFVATTSRLIFILPLGIVMKKLGDAAKNNPKINFPHKGTTKFDAFNFAVNHSAGIILSIPTAALVVFLVAKIMDKLMHVSKKENNSADINNKQNLSTFSKMKNTQEDKTHEN